MFFHIEQVGDFRSPPAIDALVIITDHAEVPMLPRHCLYQLELRGISILIFIDHYITIFGPALFQRVGMFCEKLQG